jgi:hypothetical protein
MNKLVALGVLAAACCVGVVWSSRARAGDVFADPTPTENQLPKQKPVKPGKITLRHEARKVLSCEKAVEDKETVCRPAARDPAKSGAKIKINPIDDEASKGEDSASGLEALSVELENQVGEQSRVVEIGPGKWELVWQGATTLRDKFFVDPGDEFDIALQTDIGVCRLKGEQCSVDSEKRQQSIEIPTERGL